jgi:DNA recombination protein RmuC
MSFPEFGLAFLAIICIVLSIILIMVLRRERRSDSQSSFEAAVQLLRSELIGKQAESFLTLRQAIDSANQVVNERLAEGAGALDRRLALFSEIQNKLGELSTQTTNIEQIGKNIQTLSELLRPPKLRGSLGEMLLENLLGQILPLAMFETQHQFTGGQRVDAVVKFGDRLLSIDAKFPLEAFERVAAAPGDPAVQKEFSTVLRKHVDAIAGKYIRPDEHSLDFAVMYIPAESVYYQLISQEDRGGFEYALFKKVIPSSPGHLYAFLASLAALYAGTSILRGSLNDETVRLVRGLNELSEALDRLLRLHERIEGSLRTVNNCFEKAKAETTGLHRQVDRLREPSEPAPVDVESGERTDGHVRL